MTDKQKLKETTKKMIRATLTPSQRGLKAREFLRQYRMDAMSPLPYRELGYGTPEDFYRDIPDVVGMRWEGGEMILVAIPDEKTQHLSRMVANQKSNSSRRTKRSGPTRRSMHGQSRYYSASGHRTHNQPRIAYHVRPTVPALLRGQIRELLFSWPGGLLGSNFDLAFTRRFGQSLSHMKLGFSTQLELLRSISDLVEIRDLESGGYKLYGRHAPRQRMINDAPSMPRPPPEEEPHRPPRSMEALGIDDTKSLPSDDEFLFDDDDDECIDDSSVSPQLRKQIQEVLASRPEGIWAARFQAEFKLSTGKELPLKDVGYLSVIELMSSLPDVVTIERPTPRDWLLTDARIRKSKGKQPDSAVKESGAGDCARATGSQSNASSEPHLDTAPPVSEDFKETLRQVLQAHRGGTGLLMGSLQQVFKALTGKRLDYVSLGYATLEDLVLELSDVISLDYQGEGQILLRAVNNGLSPRDDLLIKDRTVEIVNRSKEKPSRRSIAVDAVGPGASFTPIKLPTEHINDYVEVFVSNVITPNNFCLQLKGVNTTERLEHLMDQLEALYEGPRSEDYDMPDSLLTVGQICAAIFPEDENWHRVTITGIHDMDFVDVYYIDYGGSCAVPKKQLKLLKNRFLQLPAMAIPARLANIYPIDGEWGRVARDAMLNMCANKPLLALITDITSESTLSVCLCDTSGEEDLHVNDALVQKNYATFTRPPPEESRPPEGSRSPAEAIAQEDPAVQVVYGGIKLGEYTRSESSQITLPDTNIYDNLADTKTCDQKSQSSNEDADVVSMPTLEAATSSSESAEESKLRHIKFVQLTPQYSFHIVKYDNCGYVVNAEVSALLWEGTVLRSMLRQGKHNIRNLVLPQEENTEIFEQFVRYGVKGTMEGDTVKSHVTMYDLVSTLQILEIFNHDSEALKAAVTKEITQFDPNDPYWKGEDPTPEVSEPTNSLYELSSRLSELQAKRKRLLQAMAVQSSHSGQLQVEELQEIEEQILSMRQQVQNSDTAAQMPSAEPPHPKTQQGATVAGVPPMMTESSRLPAPGSTVKSVNTVAPMPASATTTAAMTTCPTSQPFTAAAGGMPSMEQMSLLMSSMGLAGGATNVSMAAGQGQGQGIPAGGQGLSNEHQQLLLNYQMLLSQVSNLNMQGVLMPMMPSPQVNQMFMPPQMNPLLGNPLGPQMMDFRALSTAGLNPSMAGPATPQATMPGLSGLYGQGRGLARQFDASMPHPPGGLQQGKPQ